MIVGRGAELARVRQVLAGAQAGHGGALLVTGEAGIGKTTLLRESLRDTDAVWLIGVEAERDLPYAALTQLVTQLSPYAAHLAEPQRAALDVVLGRTQGVDPGRLMLSMAVLSLIASAAEEGVLVVAVDDIHWLDPASRDVLLFVARRLVAERVAVLVTLREGALGLELVGGLPTVELSGLAETDAASVLPRVDAGVVRTLVHHTGGNPLALIELGATLDVDQAAGVRPLPRDLGHTRPEQAYAARLAVLDASERQVARLTALSAEAPREVLLAALRRLNLSLSRLAPVERLGLVAMTDRVAWRHPLARSAAAQGTAAELMTCHAALAFAWAAIQPTNPARAWHLAESVVGPDVEASAALAAVARVAADRGAWAEAADAWERAARLHPEPERRAHLLAEAGMAAGSAGDCARGAALLDETLAIVADPGTELLLARARLAQALSERRDVHSCLHRLMQATSDPRVRMRCAAELASWTPYEELHATLVNLNRLISGNAHDADDPVQEFCFRFIQAHLASVEGRYRDAESWKSEAHAGLATDRVLEIDPTLLPLATVLDLYAGARSGIRPHEQRALRAARVSGDLLTLVPALMYTTQRAVFAGDFAGAVDNWREVEMLARMAGMRFLFIWAAQNLVETDAHAGRFGDARARLAEVRAWRTGSSTPWQEHNEPWLEAYILLADGQRTSAVEVLRPTISGLRPDVNHNLPIYIALIHETEGREGAIAEVDRLAHLSSSQYYPLATVIAGHDDRAAAAGIEEYAHAGGPPWDIGFLRLHVARRLARAGDPERAADLFLSALERFTKIDATPWIDTVKAELGDRVAESRHPSNGSGLTAAEQRIASLVAEGHTNKDVAALLFVSPKTVEFHLSSVYRKLGVANRTALARRIVDMTRTEAHPAAPA